jgi:hypothetical protein
LITDSMPPAPLRKTVRRSLNWTLYNGGPGATRHDRPVPRLRCALVAHTARNVWPCRTRGPTITRLVADADRRFLAMRHTRTEHSGHAAHRGGSIGLVARRGRIFGRWVPQAQCSGTATWVGWRHAHSCLFCWPTALVGAGSLRGSGDRSGKENGERLHGEVTSAGYRAVARWAPVGAGAAPCGGAARAPGGPGIEAGAASTPGGPGT